MPPRRLHKTTRCIIPRQGFVLAMRAKGSAYCGLPGGHLDPGEQAIDALIREIREELGVELGYLEWLTTIEHDWEGELVHESMELYAAHTIPLSCPLRAQEAHLTAEWVQWWQGEASGLRPRQVYPWIATVTRRWP